MRDKIGRTLLAAVIVTSCVSLTGCKPKGANALIRQAKREHGPCDVVSRETNEEGSVVVLRDQLQGFEYQVSSYMTDINIDGSSFGSLPNTTDTFDWALHFYVLDEAADELDAVCDEYGLSLSDDNNLCDCYWYQVDSSVSDEDAIEGIEKIAEIMQEYNLESRMDGWTIYLEHDNEWLSAYYDELMSEPGHDYYSDPEYEHLLSPAGGGQLKHIGSVRLPDTSFRDEAKEAEDYYLEMAQMKNEDAVFIRSEQRPFSDTGVSLVYVVESYGQFYPHSEDDMVTYYYFEADGQEFFICNFLVNNNVEYGEWYSNYDEVFN